MKRLGIFVFYNERGIVQTYVELLIKNIHEILDEMVIVVNGMIQPNEKLKLNQYAKSIYVRENIGYDGGAYKDVFQKFLKNENWADWDEVLLMNDTFYGPFSPWKEIFEVMEGRACDFWGLSCHPGGETGLLRGEVISAHVQSYFILIKKTVFLHESFLQFWDELQYPTCFKEAVRNFEIRFSKYLVDLGFCFESWLEVQKERLKITKVSGNQIAMIEKLHFPILKRKQYMLHNYIEFKKILEYLSKNTKYQIKAIMEDIQYRCEVGIVYHPYNPRSILKFCSQYKKIYLYGMGMYAQNLKEFLDDNGISLCGYVVTKTDMVSDRVFIFEEFNIEEDMGIIVALNQKYYNEVCEALKVRIPPKQLILPVFE